MTLKELYKTADYKDSHGMLFHGDCLEIMKNIEDKTADFVLTDIPYAEVNRSSNGLRNLDKGNADVLTFNWYSFLEELYRITSNSICVFCGREQFSTIYSFFANKKGTVRPIVWEKTNPSPMNGQHIYLSGVEFAIWFKKSGGGTFNARCKNVVFRYPNGRSKLHPTEKNHDLLRDLILDNTMGSGSTGIAALNLNRNFIGIELDKKYFDIAEERIKELETNRVISK